MIGFSPMAARSAGPPPSATDETQSLADEGNVSTRTDEATCWHLVLLWNSQEPDRTGEVCAVPHRSTLGRGSDTSAGDPPKLEWSRARPGNLEPTGALLASTLSRTQWRLEPQAKGLLVTNLGKAALVHNGGPTSTCLAGEGDTLEIEGVALFLVEERPRVLSTLDYQPFPFGSADKNGLIGESVAAWQLRRDLLSLARGASHVLILGESGTGKELCTRAIHEASVRQQHAFVSRSAATIPSSLIEAELFGQVAGYPNAGSPARKGLVGAADRGTLFLDELGELGELQQASLLRLMDHGEYQRLGEDRPRRADVRILAATNRPESALKGDLLARFAERLHVPSLNRRRSDVPLIASALLRRFADESSTQESLSCQPRLLAALVRHDYSFHVRELERLLRRAAREATDGRLEWSSAVAKDLRVEHTTVPTPDSIRATLAESPNATEAAKRLGLSSRFALARLMKKLGMTDLGEGSSAP